MISKRSYNEIAELWGIKDGLEHETIVKRVRFKEASATGKDTNIISGVFMATGAGFTIESVDELQDLKINAKMRIRGGWWRVTNIQKVAMTTENMTRPYYKYYISLRGFDA